MNAKNILVAALLVSAAGLSAVSIVASANDNVSQGKTREEVQAELIQAHSGNWTPINEEILYSQTTVSTKTRAEVHNELMQALASGWHAKKESDATGKNTAIRRSRVEVQAELQQARAQEAVSSRRVSDN